MALRKTRRTEQRRRLPEPEPQPRRIPGPRQLPVPEPAPPPVPALGGRRLEEIEQQFRQRQLMEQRLRLGGRLLEQPQPQPLIRVSPQLASIAGQIAAPFTKIPAPGFNLPERARAPVTQADLPQAGVSEGFDAALTEARTRAADFSDPMNTIEAAAGHVMVSLNNNYSPPFIMYEVQAHWGWSDADMERAGYVRGLGGWTLDVGEGDLPTTTVDSGEGGGVGGGASWSFPALGGSRNSFRSSSLINWRI